MRGEHLASQSGRPPQTPPYRRGLPWRRSFKLWCENVNTGEPWSVLSIVLSVLNLNVLHTQLEPRTWRQPAGTCTWRGFFMAFFHYSGGLMWNITLFQTVWSRWDERFLKGFEVNPSRYSRTCTKSQCQYCWLPFQLTDLEWIQRPVTQSKAAAPLNTCSGCREFKATIIFVLVWFLQHLKPGV